MKYSKSNVRYVIYTYKRNDANRNELSKLLIELDDERLWHGNLDFPIETGSYHVANRAHITQILV